MNNEKWQDVKGIIKDKFKVLDERVEELPDKNIPGTVEIIEFIGPLGKMRLERTDQALVIGKKTFGSKRIGSITKVDYVLSDTERVNKFRAYKWDESSESWVEMSLDRGDFLLS